VLTELQGTAERGNATTGLKYGPIRSETAARQNNVAHPALGDKSKIYLSPLHINLGMVKYL
jgi:hypothetical protein